MRTDPTEDPVAATRRRLEEFTRLWAPGPGAGAPDSEDGRGAGSGAGQVDVPLPPEPRAGDHRGHRGHRDPTVVALPLHPRHLGLIAVVAVVFVLVAIWWTARGAAEPMPVADTTPAAAPVAPGTGAASPSSDSSSPQPSATPSATPAAVVVVDVAGKVRRPTVVTLPAGSRVVDAIRKAGGARPGVDLSNLNLARVLVDGEQVLVGPNAPRRQVVAPTAPSSGGSSSGGSSSGQAGGSAGGSAVTGGRTDLNRATAAELEELPGIGPVTAQKIVEWRTEHGSFTSAEELLEVDGIGPKTLAEITPAVTW